MSNYSQITAFTPKDSLTTGNPAKIIKGADFDAEFASISTAIASKIDSTTLDQVNNTSDATKNAAVATLTNKTINLNANTLTGTTAEFNTALSDGSFATLDGTETLTNKTITNLNYTGTLTGGTGVVNIGSGQLVKDASGNLLVGTTTPYGKMAINNGTDRVFAVSNGINNGSILLSLNTANTAYRDFDHLALSHNWYSNQSSAVNMKLDSSGNLLVGGTSNTFNARTLVEGTSGYTLGLRHTGIVTWYLNAKSDASLVFDKDGAEAARFDLNGNLTPGVDNTQTNGSAAKRWSVIYAGTGTINTSDAREKTAVRSFADDELAAAIALSKEVGVYQFLDSVKAKGDKARHHIGMTVQRAIEIMQSHGLDPFAYGFICYDKWDEQVIEHPATEDKDAWTEVTLKAGDRYSFRYDQLSLFIARGIDARLAALEAK